nr:HEPN domain-containing protein [Clostridium sp. MCC344]
MEGSLKELAGYRMDRAKEMLVAARENLEIGQYKTSLNRSYYAIFHAMRAMNILKGFDSSKHSGVIAFFNKEYLKENILDRNLSIVIKNSAFLREKSDYDDFYIASKQEAEKQLEEAERFLDAVEIAINKMK